MAARRPRRLFLLSPAHVGGLRAKFLLNPRAPFALAKEFHARGLPLADVFTFTSGLYFRGKIAYARHFARPEPRDFVRVITSNAGLLDPRTRIDPDALRAFGATDIDAADPKYRRPLIRDARKLATVLGPDGVAILLGSIATPKYRDALLEVFGTRLLFPIDFVGRGDMSRGALLLRAARADRELTYVAVADAVLTGKRAPSVNARRKKVWAKPERGRSGSNTDPTNRKRITNNRRASATPQSAPTSATPCSLRPSCPTKIRSAFSVRSRTSAFRRDPINQ